MKQVSATVNESELICADMRTERGAASCHILRLECPEIAAEARPGQFIMAACGEETTLRRPLSIHAVSGDEISLLFKVFADGRGTPWLAARKPGDTVGLLGPLGNGFTLLPEAGNLLLVAGGMGIAPLNFMADRVSNQGLKVTLLAGAATAAQLFNCPDLPNDKVWECTDDGSRGRQGLVTELLPEHINACDQVFICGPIAMYRALAADRKRLLGDKPVQVSLEVRMGCGCGLCFSCTIRTKKGLKQVCQDGPVFDFDDVIWDEVEC